MWDGSALLVPQAGDVTSLGHYTVDGVERELMDGATIQAARSVHW